MAVKFENSESAYIDYGSVGWLDNVSAHSVYCRARIDDTTGTNQFLFRHRNGGGGPQISIRKEEGTPDKFKVSVSNSDTYNVAVSTTGVVQGTVYDLAFTWETNDASGLKLYVDGALEATTSTTDQPSSYSTNNGALYVGAAPDGTSYGRCTIERLMFFPGTILTLAQVQALGAGYYPHILNVPQPAAFYPMFGDVTSRIIDMSGNARHITNFQLTPSLESSLLGQWMDPHPFDDSSAETLIFADGPEDPDPWALVDEMSHPTNTKVVSGLSNGTAYEFKLNAVDDSGLVSGDSSIVEATPTTVTATPATAIPWRRARTLSKWG